jgi:ElaB/YqjD/DUF883 family membrane-anchored ribosome-binding protein
MRGLQVGIINNYYVKNATACMQEAHKLMSEAEEAMASGPRGDSKAKKLIKKAEQKIEQARKIHEETADNLAQKFANEAKDKALKLQKDTEAALKKGRRGKKEAAQLTEQTKSKLVSARKWVQYKALDQAVEQTTQKVAEEFVKWELFHLVDGLVSLAADVWFFPGVSKGTPAVYRLGKRKITERYASTTDPDVACGICHACQGGHGSCANRRNA